MRRLLLAIAVPTGALTLAGCATMGVGTYVAHPLDPAQYVTYDWGPQDALPVGDPRLDNNGIFQDHLIGAIDRGLAARAIARAAAGQTADLLIHYHATVERRVVVEADHPGDRSPAYGPARRMREFEAGTLVFDLLDARTRKLVWRGWVEDTLENMIHDQAQIERYVDIAVARLMERLPFGRTDPGKVAAASPSGNAGGREPTGAEMREWAARARTPADHRALEEYFLTRAKRLRRDANAHTAAALALRGTKIANASDHCERLAARARADERHALARAEMHRALAQLASDRR